MDKFIAKFGRRTGQPYVLFTRDVSVKSGIVYLPLYMASQLRGVGSMIPDRKKITSGKRPGVSSPV